MLNQSNPTSERYYTFVARQENMKNFEPGKLSAGLREALGITEYDDPPYYRSIRAFGFPPSYYGTLEDYGNLKKSKGKKFNN